MLSDKVIEKIFAKKEIQKLDLMTVSLTIRAVGEAIEEVEEENADEQSSIQQSI